MSLLPTSDAVTPWAKAPIVWLPAWAVAMLGAVMVTAGLLYFIVRARRARAASTSARARGRHS